MLLSKGKGRCIPLLLLAGGPRREAVPSIKHHKQEGAVLKRNRFLAAALLLLALLLSGCGLSGASAPEPEPAALTGGSLSAARDLLDAQLGVLKDELTEKEYSRCMDFMARLWPLRQTRLEAGKYEKSDQERRLIERLNQLYERYSAKYLGDGGDWGYASPAERTLAEYVILPDGNVKRDKRVPLVEGGGWVEADYLALWDQMRAILPEGAYRDFTRFTVFTDGVDETLAYVNRSDYKGGKWEIAVDPADAEDGEWFTETVLHEYTHYLTLNSKQVVYTCDQTGDAYNEEGMVARKGSYLDDFYQAFWTGYLDDRLANPDSYNFFLRHEDDFITDYASTDPSEDIAECFAYFVLWDRRDGDEVWERKLDFFYDYPELVRFRAGTRARLDLE